MRPLMGAGAAGISGMQGGGNVAQTGWWFAGSSIDLDFQNNLASINSNPAGLATSQMSITRTTPGYAQSTATGLWTSFSSGQFRQTDKGLLVEEQRTNNLLQCRDMTQAAWVKVNVTAALNQVGIDGAANSASSLTSTLAAGTVLQTLTLGSAADTYSVWLKRLSGSGVVNISADGTTWTPVTLTTAYQQFQLQQTLANPVCGIQIMTNGDSVAADFNQLENASGGYATSPILTTVAAATRNADVVLVNSFAQFTMSGGTGYLEWAEIPGPISVSRKGLNAYVSSTNKINLGPAATNTVAGSVVSGGATVSAVSTNSVVANTVYRTALAFAPNDGAAAFTASLNGAVVTSVPVVPIGSTTAVSIGSDNSVPNGYLDGYVRRVTWFQVRQSNAQILAWAQGSVGP